jgi:hypothetical protein
MGIATLHGFFGLIPLMRLLAAQGAGGFLLFLIEGSVYRIAPLALATGPNRQRSPLWGLGQTNATSWHQNAPRRSHEVGVTKPARTKWAPWLGLQKGQAGLRNQDAKGAGGGTASRPPS